MSGFSVERLRIAVVIPGILGSSLRYGTDAEIWSGDFGRNYRLLTSNPAVLHWNGKPADVAEVIEQASFSAIPFVRHDLWGGTLRWLKTAGPDLVGTLRYGYDWRASLCDTADALRDFLKKFVDSRIARPGPRPDDAPSVVMITHSMGGLVARIAVGLGLIHPSWIDQIVHIGTPIMGAPSAFRTAYDRAGLPYLSQLLSVRRWKNSESYFRILQQNFQSFPSLYQLFPPPRVGFLYYGPQQHRRNPLNEGVVPAKFKKYAADAHAALAQADVILRTAGAAVAMIYTDSSRKTRTEHEYAVERIAAPVPRYNVRGAHAATERGDGTVPSYSAGPPSVYGDLVPVIDADHAYMCNNRRVVKLYAGLI